MNDNLNNTMIFHGMNDEEISETLNALSAIEKKYKKNSVIFHSGKITEHMGLVLEGSVTIENNDFWGNRTILSHVGKGEFFGESFALLHNEPMLVDVVANEDCKILFLRIGNLKNSISSSDIRTMKFITNLLFISANKNLALLGRSFHTSPKTIRGKVMAYLNSMSLKTGTNEFNIPFNRQQLADYLNVERTALSKELGKMQKKGIIFVKKNRFKIVKFT